MFTLGMMLKSRQEIGNALLANERVQIAKEKGIEEEVEEALKRWFTKARENDARRVQAGRTRERNGRK